MGSRNKFGDMASYIPKDGAGPGAYNLSSNGPLQLPISQQKTAPKFQVRLGASFVMWPRLSCSHRNALQFGTERRIAAGARGHKTPGPGQYVLSNINATRTKSPSASIGQRLQVTNTTMAPLNETGIHTLACCVR